MSMLLQRVSAQIHCNIKIIMFHRLSFLFIISLLWLVWGCASVSDLNTDVMSNDWSIFRGSSALNGYVDRELPDNPQLQWTFANDVRTVSSPIVYNDNIYTIDRKGVIRGIDGNGMKFMEHDMKTPVEASFIIRDSIMYVGRIDGFVTALKVPSMKKLWEYETLGQISASPNTIVSDKGTLLLIGSYDNSMYVFNSADGALKEKFETGYYINGAASVYREYVLFGGCDRWLRMVNANTGKQTDSLELKAYVPSSPVIFDDKAYVSDYNGDLYEMEIRDGKFANSRMLIEVEKDDEDGGVVSMPTVSEDVICILTGNRHLKCIERKSGKVRWTKLLRGDTGESAPLICRDKILLCTKDGHVSIFSSQSGKELWHYEVGEQIIASPAVLNHCFYIQTSRGKLLKFSPTPSLH